MNARSPARVAAKWSVDKGRQAARQERAQSGNSPEYDTEFQWALLNEIESWAQEMRRALEPKE